MVRAHESYSVLQSDWMRHTCGPCILLGDVDRVIASHPFTTTPTADAPTGGA
jgi:hypothetical protein